MSDSTVGKRGQDEPVVVVIACDDKYAMSAAVTLFSALMNVNPDRLVEIYVLDAGLSIKNRARVADVLSVDRVTANLHWVEPDLSALDHVEATDRFSLAAYMRLLVPDLLPGDLDRAIYLDSDLVVEGDLAQLWDESFNGNCTLAAPDFWNAYFPKRLRAPFDIPADALYYNSGVLVMNLERWRQDKIGHAALSLISDYPGCLPFPDQDALNLVMIGNCGTLDPTWNVTPTIIHIFLSYFDISDEERRHMREELTTAPNIIHYTISPKPWEMRYLLTHARHRINVSSRRPWKADFENELRFFRYLDRSGWCRSTADVWWRHGLSAVYFVIPWLVYVYRKAKHWFRNG